METGVQNSIIVSMKHLFTLGNFTLHSGAESRWKIDCDALMDDDIKTLAGMIQLMTGMFSEVEGIPRGGLRLAEALKPYRTLQGKYLLVDDVLTTGESMISRRDNFLDAENTIGAVIFARGQCPHWIKPLFQMPEKLWTKPRTR